VGKHSLRLLVAKSREEHERKGNTNTLKEYIFESVSAAC
jgi:hypothetical protein